MGIIYPLPHLNGIGLNMNSDKKCIGLVQISPYVPGAHRQAGRINLMTLVQHNTQMIHNVAMMDLKVVEGLGTL